MQPRVQCLHRRAACRCFQKQGPVQGLHKGALTGFVGTADQGDTRRELEAEIAMESHVLQLAIEQTHDD